MPTIRLTSVGPPPFPLTLPTGGTLQVPRIQFRCLVRLPHILMPQDGIIDTGAPLICFPFSIWDRFQLGIDYEWLPFEPGFTPPVGQMVGWRYTFRMARFLVPIGLMDLTTEATRVDVIAQFADNDPPGRGGQSLPQFIIGLWGGLLEGGKIAVTRTPAGHVEGNLELP